MKPRDFAKSIIASLTALGTWGTTALSDGAVEAVEWFGLTGVIVAGLAVFAYPNARPRGAPAENHG